MRQILIIIIFFSLSSCSTLKNIEKKRDVISYIHNSPCNGTCDFYKIIFYSDGTGVKYDKTKNKETYFKFSLSDFKEILLLADNIELSKIGNKYYNRGLQDIQVKTIFINGKSIKFNEDPPFEIIQLYKRIKKIYYEKL